MTKIRIIVAQIVQSERVFEILLSTGIFSSSSAYILASC